MKFVSIKNFNILESDVTVVKPLSGIDVQKVAPIIKRIDEPSVKLASLDLEPNDYVTEFKINQSKQEIKVSENTLTLTKSIKLSAREENSIAESKENQDILISVRVCYYQM